MVIVVCLFSNPHNWNANAQRVIGFVFYGSELGLAGLWLGLDLVVYQSINESINQLLSVYFLNIPADKTHSGLS